MFFRRNKKHAVTSGPRGRPELSPHVFFAGPAGAWSPHVFFRSLGLAGGGRMLFFSQQAAWGISASDPLLVLFRVPFWSPFWALYEPRNTMNSKDFGDFREAFWPLFRLIFGPGLHGFMTGPAGLGGVGSGQNCRRMFFFAAWRPPVAACFFRSLGRLAVAACFFRRPGRGLVTACYFFRSQKSKNHGAMFFGGPRNKKHAVTK